MPSSKVVWKSKTSWRAKLHKPMQPKLVPVPEGMAKRLGSGMMLIPTALEIDAIVRKIPRGQVSSISQIRRRLAHWHNVDVTCPLVTGIFFRIVAEAAEEDRMAGKHDITPYWRVVREDGGLNAKLPGGIDEQTRLLVEEGHTVVNGKLQLPAHRSQIAVKLRA
ncbi:MAG TPA: MGMT family protein [Candidatus Acidoferrum sp.]